MSNAYHHRIPVAGESIEVRAVPPDASVTWQPESAATALSDGAWRLAWPKASEPLFASDRAGRMLLALPLDRPVSVVQRPLWWNVLVANPAGYLPADAEIDRLELDLPTQAVLPWGPSWLRAWYTPFFVVLALASLVIKVVLRIE
jgi:hypothetical protein